MLLTEPSGARWSLVHPVEGIADTTLPCFPFETETLPDLESLADVIRRRIDEEPRRKEFCLTFPEQVGPLDVGLPTIRLRVVWTPPALSSIVVNCRKLELKPPSVDDLGIERNMRDWLVARGGAILSQNGKSYRPGGVIVCGDTSVGKTTTMTALIVHFLEQLGGTCYNMGTSPEYALEGPVGNSGFMVQVLINEFLGRGEWKKACTASLKWNPAIVALGEIGDPESAQAFIGMCNSNRLVTTTLHAESPAAAFGRLAHLATEGVSSVSDTIKSIAEHTSLIIFQKLTENGADLRILDIAAWRDHNATEVEAVFKDIDIPKVLNRVKADTEAIAQGRWRGRGGQQTASGHGQRPPGPPATPVQTPVRTAPPQQPAVGRPTIPVNGGSLPPGYRPPSQQPPPQAQSTQSNTPVRAGTPTR